MGLDVYMYRMPEGETPTSWKQKYDEQDKASNAYWELDDDARKAATEPKELESERIEFKHPEFPDNINEIGYFRSSYNSGGINSILRKAGLPDMYNIFFGDEQGGEQYIVFPKWEECLARAEDVLARYRAEVGEGGRLRYRVERANALPMRPEAMAADEEEALNWFLEEREKAEESKRQHAAKPTAWGPSVHYSTGRGEFDFTDNPGIVRGVIAAKLGDMESPIDRMIKGPGLFLVREIPPSWNDSYEQSLEIIVDTIKYTLDNGPSDRYYLHWSA